MEATPSTDVTALHDLGGRHALVTGSGGPGGIGLATARRLGRMGARVTVAATSERIHERAAELREEGIDAVGAVADLTRETEVAALADAVGRVDVLVNNAGMTSVTVPGEDGSLAEMTPATWRASLERNLTSAYLVSRVLVGGMVAAGWGRVVLVSSVTGPVAASPGTSPTPRRRRGWSASRARWRSRLGGAGVTVNAVAPGWIDTPSATPRERRMGAATPVGRPGTADEVAAVIAFLCAPEASYVTGAMVVVDGGNTVREERG